MLVGAMSNTSCSMNDISQPESSHIAGNGVVRYLDKLLNPTLRLLVQAGRLSIVITIYVNELDKLELVGIPA